MTEMMDVSFGKLGILLKKHGRPLIEHLIFEKEGRPHIHREFETFFVIAGCGKVRQEDRIQEVRPGSLVTIAPNTKHWMIPDTGETLEGFLWYHEKPLLDTPETVNPSAPQSLKGHL